MLDPELQLDLQELTKILNKSNTSTRNRLLSILKDSNYVQRLQSTGTIPSTIPVIPNERCGQWYLPPSTYETTCYFKSTDGHINNWDISTRRLNLHLIPVIASHGGIAIVDSTRRGKRMPDALSKTVPIWCAVLNNIMDDGELNTTNGSSTDETKVVDEDPAKWLFTPPGTVSPSEHQRISKKLPQLIKKMKDVNAVTSQWLNDQLQGKRLRPVWMYPGIGSSSAINFGEDILPVYLVTASEMCQDGANKSNGYTYVQGAADDHELCVVIH
ncbi:unnamed protein product [Ambrosiozyma monospora]|uniref:Unnamed protein product n=1 Tax=Ambrosiozyma monospora TaxID=43982 RepID=A0ACB5TTY8_AMBMO|nr:unnamed protein product [Ambrosiozyma monospora]